MVTFKKGLMQGAWSKTYNLTVKMLTQEDGYESGDGYRVRALL